MNNTESKGTDRPAGTVDEDANPPLTDPTTTDVDPDTANEAPPRMSEDPSKDDVQGEKASQPPQDARLTGPAGT
jgi:hypothetical protein